MSTEKQKEAQREYYQRNKERIKKNKEYGKKRGRPANVERQKRLSEEKQKNKEINDKKWISPSIKIRRETITWMREFCKKTGRDPNQEIEMLLTKYREMVENRVEEVQAQATCESKIRLRKKY